MFTVNAYIYLIKNDWNIIIPGLGDTLLKRILIGTYLIGSLVCMYGIPFQALITYFMKSRNKVNLILNYFPDELLPIGTKVDPSNIYRSVHICNGILITFSLMITSIAGSMYVFVYGTIGGTTMDIAFGLFGTGTFLFAIFHLVYAYKLWTKNDKNYNTKIHKLITTHLAAIIYSSFFYRVQYAVLFLMDYPIPDNETPDRYFRPLDQFLVFSFYLIPNAYVAIYNLMIYHKNKKIVFTMQIFHTILLVASIIVIFILNNLDND
jgi:hypothetical protein